ncbi:MAG: hypothetical protein US33_C0014G0001 [Parcubacteria group bacterium GW2011_GWC1_36_9]|nr:MAG: hypothetical protein US33_C0014G0001 [Parcubacteria group bacterium GW2011_GWC1_36_9]
MALIICLQIIGRTFKLKCFRPYRLTVRTRPSQGLNRGSIPRRVTKTELNGFFKARRWDARSASH